MIGSFLTSGLILALGYAYPAYECYKVVDKNKPEIEQLRFWCQYWILVAVLTIFERLGGDAFISWLPMYSEAKLAFYIYLWYPKTRGTAYVYDTFFQPYVAKHEVEIDRSIMELRARAGDVAVLYMQKAAAYGQTRFFEILQYVASQSQPSRSRPAQRRQQETTQQQVQKPPPPPIVPDRRAAVLSPPPPTQQTTTISPPSPARGLAKEPDPAAPTTVAPPSPSKAQLAVATSTTGKPGSSETSTEPSKGGCTAKPSDVAEESMLVDQVAAVTTSKKEDSSSSNSNPNSTQNPKETVMEETLRVTRGRLRRARSITTTPTATR